MKTDYEKEMKTFAFFISFLLFSAAFYSQENSYSIGDHELMAQPTAYTMPQGNSYFTVYEGFILNYTYAVSSSTHLGLLVAFPITVDLITDSFTLGAKQNYFKYGIVQSALFGGWTPKANLYMLGNVISIGKPSNGLHLSVSYTRVYEGSTNDDWLFDIGYRHDFTENVGGILEYHSFNEIFVSATLFVGIRFHYEYTSWEIGGFRPLNIPSRNLIMFPFIKGSYYFH